MSLFQKAPATAEEAAQWGPLAIGPDKVKDMTEAEWYAKVYRGADAPQLTWRAVIMGSVLGFGLAFTNLYVGLKTGWGLGVAITACILSYAIWNGLMALGAARSPMTLLENNCMQSTASSAGYATGTTVISAVAALLMIEGQHMPWQPLAMWTFFLGVLGTALAIPMKRNMINRERLPFPSGLAAATTLQSLYSEGAEALRKAKALLVSGVVGAVYAVLTTLHLRTTADGEKTGLLPESLNVFDVFKWGKSRENGESFKASDWLVNVENSPVMIAAGALMGLRTTTWMMISGGVLAFALGPWGLDQAWTNPDGVVKYAVSIPQQAWREVGLWLGAPILVSSGLLMFAIQWKTIVAALRPGSASDGGDPRMAETEVPSSWMWALVAFGGVGTLYVAHAYFHIPYYFGALALVMTFFLSLVACRATGETDITPIGPMGKVMQLTYGVLIPNSATANLMTASITANAAGSSADLLNDLKAGYLLGANPRRQFIAQLAGVITGTIATTWGFHLLVPDAAVLTGADAKFPAPAAASWKAVADVFQHGIGHMHETHRNLMFIGLSLGAVFVILEHLFPKARKFLPSASGVGLGLILQFFNPLSMFVGALIAFFWEKQNRESADRYLVPVVAGVIAGAALMGVLTTILNNTVLE